MISLFQFMSHTARSSSGLPDSVTPTRKKPSAGAAEKAFLSPYRNQEMSVGTFMQQTCRTVGMWSRDKGKQPKYHSCFMPMVQASLMGKSKLMLATLSTTCFGIYINVSENAKGVPPPNPRMRDWLLEHGAVSLGHHADLNIQAFILACGIYLQRWLSATVVEDFSGEMPEQEHLFQEWLDLQLGDEFWDTILNIQADQVVELCQFSNLRRLSQDLSSRHRNAALQALKSGFTGRPTGIPDEEWNKTDSAWYDLLASEFERRLRDSSESINNHLSRARSTGTREKWMAVWKSKRAAYVWPAWILAIDEARTLLKGATNDESVFHNLRNTSRHFPQGLDTIILIMTDSTSKISNFAPPGDVSPSRRHIGNTLRFGTRLFQPFCDITCMDVHVPRQEKISDLLSYENMCCYGRAAFGSYARHEPPEAVNARLQEKLIGHDGTLDNPGKSACVAILAFLVSLNVNAYAPLAAELTSTHLQKLARISDDRRAVDLISYAETVLAIAARSLANWTKLFKILNQRGISDIDVGAHGETASQILLIIAIGEAEKELKITGLPSETRELTVYPVPLFNVLKKLGVYDYLEKPEYLHALQHWEPFLKRAHVRVVQFSRSISEFDPDYMLGRFCRGSGIVCKRNYKGVDGFIPLYLSSTPLDSAINMEDATLSPDRMSFVGLQFKNNAASLGPAEYEKLSVGDMDAESVLGYSHFAWPDHLMIVSLLIDVGKTCDGKPKVWVFNKKNQLSIVVRGVRPSHILSAAATEEELDDGLNRFITCPSKIQVNGFTIERLKRSHADLYVKGNTEIFYVHGDALREKSAETVACAKRLLNRICREEDRNMVLGGINACEAFLELSYQQLQPVAEKLSIARLSLATMVDKLHGQADEESSCMSFESSDSGEIDQRPVKRARSQL